MAKGRKLARQQFTEMVNKKYSEKICFTCGNPSGQLCSNPEQVGKAVDCNVCGRCKAPRGRSVPLDMANSLCDDECEGYNQSPLPGELWPGETREDFGY